MGNITPGCTWPSCICDKSHCKVEDPDYYIGLRDKTVRELRDQIESRVIYDTVWIVAYPVKKNIRNGILYHPPGTSAQEAWRNCATFLADMGRSWSNKELRKKGFRARRFDIVLREKDK